ncbi:MAG: hypothetical protein GY749_41240 [Desulfobacteraceae bacterium]|nr:hypothetical protein [Desulfobacteraceae bacterium]
MNIALVSDRPGWIPPDITHDWDTNPYAYQTEEELIPGGSLHWDLLSHLMITPKDFLEKKGLMLLPDSFMLFRDSKGIRQRIASDLMLIPFCSSMPDFHDLDVKPPPSAVIDITSMRNHINDLENNAPLYMELGVSAYIVINAVTPEGLACEKTGMHMWRKTNEQISRIQTDAEDYLNVPEMSIRLRASGDRLISLETLESEILYDTGQLQQLLKEERLRAEQERQKADILATKLRTLGIDPDEFADGQK